MLTDGNSETLIEEGLGYHTARADEFISNFIRAFPARAEVATLDRSGRSVAVGR